MAQKEIYRLNIKIGVDGDSEAKRKLTATEKMAEQTKKKMQALNKINANPTAKLNDQASSKLDKLGSKINKFKSASMTLTAKVKDNASATVDKIENRTKKIKEANVKVKAKDEASSVIGKIENKINGWIKAGAKKIISIGIAGVLATGGIGLGTSIKTFSAYEQGLSNVRAVTDATDTQMKQLGDTAKKLGASTAWSAVQVTDAEQLLGQAGYSVNETITALPGLLSLASAGSLDLASATSIASSTLRAFNLDASKTTHVADALALTANATNSDVTDLGESLKYVSPIANSLGISMEDAVAATGLLSNQAIVGSQAGTVLRQTLARLASPTKEAAGLMKKYGINAFDAQGNMKPLSSVVDNLNGSLGKLTSQQRADVISTIFGTESMSGVMALMNQGGQSLSDLSTKLKNAKGAADKMAETKLDNLAGQWEQLKGAVETTQINLGERLAPYAKEFVTWLTNKMPEIENKIISIVDYLSKNTTTIKTLAGTILGLGVAFATLSAVGRIGNTITGIQGLASILKGAKVAEETTKIAGGLKNIGLMGQILPAMLSPAGLAIAGTAVLAGVAITTNANLVKKRLSTTTEELGPIEKIMNKLTGSVYKSKKELSDLGLVYDDFGNGVSDNFKKAAQDASKSLLQIEMNMKRLTRDGVLSDTDNNQLKNWVNGFADEAINSLREKQSQIQNEFQKTFNLDGSISNAEQDVMEYLNSYFAEGVNKEIALRDEIFKKGNEAIGKHGKELDNAMEIIKGKLTELKAIQLEYANAESAGERAYSKSKFASKAERVTGIKGASELLQEREKERQKSVDEAKANYDKTITWTQSLMQHETDAGKKAKLQQGLNEATVARDKALKNAEDDWKSDLETLYDQYPKARGVLNERTGEILSGKDKRAQNSLDKIKSEYSGLKNITQDGFYGVRDSATGAMNAVYVTVNKATGEITGAWEYTTGQVGGYTNEIKQKVEGLKDSHIAAGAAIQTLADTQARVNIANREVTTSYGEVIGKLDNVAIAADKTRTGILSIGDKHIQITTNAAGEIIKMQEFKGSIDNIPPNTDVNINSNADSATASINVLRNAINSIPPEKSVIITTTYKKILEGFEGVLGLNGTKEKANGTSFSDGIFSTVNERGWELSDNKSVPILGSHNGNPLTYMSRGTKILNHMQSVQDMKEEVSGQVNQKIANQPKQIQYQLINPQQQLQFAGAGGPSLKIDSIEIDNNFSNGSETDFETLVDEAVQQVAYKLKQAFTNIKR